MITVGEMKKWLNALPESDDSRTIGIAVELPDGCACDDYDNNMQNTDDIIMIPAVRLKVASVGDWWKFRSQIQT